MSESLKPCPFCGKSDSLVFVDDCRAYRQIVCDVFHGGCGASSGMSSDIEDVIRVWNRRANNE